MLRMKLAGALLLVSAMICAQSHAADPALPPDVIGPDTFAVVHLDTVHFNPDGLQAAVTALLGQNAAKLDNPLRKFKEKFNAAAAAGVESLTVVVTAEKKADAGGAAAAGPPHFATIMYLQLKGGSDVEAIKTLITADMKPEDKAKTTFDSNGNFLAMHERDQAIPAKADADKTAMVTEALGSMTHVSVTVAMLPDADFQAQLANVPPTAPKGIKDAAPLLAKAKWIAVGVTLNNDPAITATTAVASADDAKALADDLSSALADVKAMVNNPNGNTQPLMLMLGPVITQLVDSLKPSAIGSQVSVGLKGPVLGVIADRVMMMMAMMGNGGFGPPRAPQ